MIKQDKLPEKIFGIESGLIIEFLPLLGIGLLFLISLNLVIIPKIDASREINSKRRELDKESELLQQKIAYLSSVDQDELKKKSELLANTLIKEKNSYFLVQVIKEVGAKFGYQVIGFSVSPGKISGTSDKKTGAKVGEVQRQPVTITLTGPRAAYVDLITGLESSIPLLSLDKMDLKNSGDVSELDLVVSAYYSEAKVNQSIGKLSLSDLTMNREENDLINRLDSYQMTAKAGDLGENKSEDDGNFVPYGRNNPFTL